MSGEETLDGRLRAAVVQYRGDPALTFLDARLDGATYTFRELFSRVDSMAVACRQAGLKPGSLVGILLATQEEQVLHYLALLRFGAVPAILTPPNRKLHRDYRTRQAIAYFLNHADWDAPALLWQKAKDTLAQLGFRPGDTLHFILDDTQQRKYGRLMQAVSKLFLHAERYYANGHTILVFDRQREGEVQKAIEQHFRDLAARGKGAAA